MRIIRLIIFLANLKEALRMLTNRANIGSLCSDDNMSAVPTIQDNDDALIKHFLSLDIDDKCTVEDYKRIFNCGYTAELLGKVMEAFLVGFLCHAGIHICPLGVFALCGMKKVFCCVTKLTESLKPKLCVLLFVLGCLQE